MARGRLTRPSCPEEVEACLEAAALIAASGYRPTPNAISVVCGMGVQRCADAAAALLAQGRWPWSAAGGRPMPRREARILEGLVAGPVINGSRVAASEPTPGEIWGAAASERFAFYRALPEGTQPVPEDEAERHRDLREVCRGYLRGWRARMRARNRERDGGA